MQQDRAFSGYVVSELVTLDAPQSDFLESFPLTVFALGSGNIGRRDRTLLSRYGFSFAYVEWLRRNATQYDCVIVHGLWNFATMAAALVLPVVMKDRYYVYAHGMMDPWFARHDPKKHFFKRLSWLAFEGRLLSRARAVLFTAPEEEDLAKGQFWGWSYNGAVVGYGVAEPPQSRPEDGLAFHEILPALSGRRFLLFMSRIHPKKGCDLLVSAFAHVAENHDVDLVIAGPDEMGLMPGLKALASELGVSERIHWPGMLQGSAKWGAYHEAEAFILPSHQENFGVVIAEAMACALPVLTTNKVNIWREVEASGGGIIRNDDEEGVVELLRSWLALSDVQKRKMAESARRGFERQFSAQYVAKRFLDLLSGHGVHGALEAASAVSRHSPSEAGSRPA
ncbi:glycosyltransferase [Caulobacter vibrioides]|uniref:glycosyltransferase n=1 Tax=Caulobacter vibrioides TaxID=155892 RepID=UPI00196B44C5|nr:glycosyltransferase [Caulobacter vibrioides]